MWEDDWCPTEASQKIIHMRSHLLETVMAHDLQIRLLLLKCVCYNISRRGNCNKTMTGQDEESTASKQKKDPWSATSGCLGEGRCRVIEILPDPSRTVSQAIDESVHIHYNPQLNIFSPVHLI